MFQKLAQGRKTYSDVPAELFALRDRADWNRANYLLRTEAAPAGERLTRILNEMVISQNSLLSADVAEAREGSERYRFFLFVSTVLFVSISVLVAFVIGRRSVAAIKKLTENARALEESEARTRAAYNTIIDALITIDGKGIIETCNLAATKIFGCEAKEMVGRNIKMLMPEPYGSGHDGYLRNFLDTGEAKVIGIGREVVGQRKDGSTFPMDLGISEMRIGNQRMFTGIVRDITERKVVDQMKSEFVSTVSHELRTPLTSIRGSLGLVSTGRLGELPDKAARMLSLAQENTDRLIDLVNDLLDMEKIQAGKMDFVFERIALLELVQQAIEDNQPYGDQYGISFHLTESVGEGVVRGDRKRLSQVLANLMSNAVKFSPKGEQIEITADRENGSFRVAVIDKGPGIREEFQGRIFERFAQEDSSDTREKGGPGLGLSISKSIIEAHGGKISFSSKPGEGAEFFFTLPGEEQANKGQDNREGGHILVLEDDPDTAEVIATMLRHGGLAACIARTAEEAFKLLNENKFDAITVDIMLPGQNGISFIREIRRREDTRKLPVIVVSVSASDNRAELVASGMNVEALLEKPFEDSHLLEAIRTAVGPEKSGLPRLLYVEDDEDLVSVVSSLVSGEVEFTAAASLAEAKPLLRDRNFDLVILDLGLPDGSGLELMPLLKNHGGQPVPVIIFSGQQLDRATLRDVEAVLVKSESSENELMAAIHSVIAAG